MENIVRNRLKVFDDQVGPILNFYQTLKSDKPLVREIEIVGGFDRMAPFFARSVL